MASGGGGGWEGPSPGSGPRRGCSGPWLIHSRARTGLLLYMAVRRCVATWHWLLTWPDQAIPANVAPFFVVSRPVHAVSQPQ